MSAATAAWAGVATTVGATGGGLLFMGMKLNVAVLGALLVVGVGTWWTTQRRLGTELAAVVNLNVGQTRELAALRNERRQLTEEIRTLKAARSTGAAVSAMPSAAANLEPEAGRSPEIIEQQRRAISINLRQIAAAREMFAHSMRRAPGSLAEIVGYRGFLRELIPVDGEDYTQLNVAEAKVFSVTTANGLAVSYHTEGGNRGTPFPGVGGENAGPPGLGAKVRQALAGFTAAKGGGVVLMPRNVKELLPFFDNAVDAADDVEWLESIQWLSR